MRKVLTYLLVVFTSTFLFLFGSWVLIKNDVIQFDWTDQIINEYNFKKAIKSDVKVLILGDSQLERWPLKHCLYKDFSEYFNDRDIGYLNAAHFGFGPIEYEDQLLQIAPVYKPDAIILCYYAGNDLSDVLYRPDQTPKQRSYSVLFDEENKDHKVFDTSSNIALNSDFDWELFEEKEIDSEIIQYAKNRIKFPSKIGPEFVNPHILAIGAWKPDYHYDNCTQTSVNSNYGWYLSLQRLQGIANIADSIGATLSIVVIPSNVQVDTSHYSFYRKTKFRVEDDLLYSNAPQHVLYDFSKANGIKYLDLLPHFKSYVESENLYFENDNHLSEEGHIWAFHTIKENLLPSLIKDSLRIKTRPIIEPHVKYEKFVVKHQMEIISSDSVWYKAVAEKAKVNSIPIDSQLFLDARFIIRLNGQESLK